MTSIKNEHELSGQLNKCVNNISCKIVGSLWAVFMPSRFPTQGIHKLLLYDIHTFHETNQLHIDLLGADILTR
jgi:hypothetical protein